MDKEQAIVKQTESALDDLLDLWCRSKMVCITVLAVIVLPACFALYQQLVKDTIQGKEEISHRRALQSFHEFDEIIDIVSGQLEVSRDEFLKKRGWGRDLTIYLLKKYSRMTNREIGGLVGGLSYSAVTKARNRFLERTTKDRRLSKKLEKICAILSNITG